VTFEFSGRHILLDVEGTTSSVSYVYDVLFPYARKQLRSFLSQHWKDEKLQRVCEQIAKDAGASSFLEWCGTDSSQLNSRTNNAEIEIIKIDKNISRVESEVIRQMDRDAKVTGLKELQGLIWTDGYVAGELRSHVYEDVAPALKSWKDAGIDVRIYSSGSVRAQKMFFANSEAGDLVPYLDGHYDTQIGPKRASASYNAIASDIGAPTEEILFLSDVVEELKAASDAGMKAALVVRPGNAPDQEGHGLPLLRSFSEITINSRASV
jgi:enolase-phosphatase E1